MRTFIKISLDIILHYGMDPIEIHTSATSQSHGSSSSSSRGGEKDHYGEFCCLLVVVVVVPLMMLLVLLLFGCWLPEPYNYKFGHDSRV